MMVMMNSHVILSAFWTAFAMRNRDPNTYRTTSPPSSLYHQQAPSHAGGQLGVTASSFFHHKYNNQLQKHHHFPCRLACLVASTPTAISDTEPGHHSVVEEGRRAAAPSNNVPQPQSSFLKTETQVHTSNATSTANIMTTTDGRGGPFMDRVRQLLEFRKEHGHCRVPKRHVENPALGTWVNKQRQEFKRFQSGKKPCALTPARIHLLESIGMCWDASGTATATATRTPRHPSSSTTVSSTMDENHEGIEIDMDEQEESAWQEELQELKQYMRVHNLTSVVDLPRQSSCEVWIKRQREKYGKLASVLWRDQNYQGARDHRHQQAGQSKRPLCNETTMTTAHASASRALGRTQQLSALDCDWYMTRRQAVWECRFRELKSYHEQYGDCCVPISFQASPQLAHWVSNQRKLYNQHSRRRQEQQQKQQEEQLQQNHHHHQHQQHQHQPHKTTTTIHQQHQSGTIATNKAMTEERQSRIERLQAIGFVWNRWDYEFSKKR
jgi:Helicase associated domain